MKTLKKIISVLTLSTLSFAFTSNAMPIEDWDWQVDAEFTAYDPVGITPSLLNTDWNSNPTKLAWGDESSIVVSGNAGNGHSTGTVALGDLTTTTTLTHNNFPISLETTLNTATLATRLLLEPNPVVLPFDIAPPALFFNIDFLETVNDSNCEVDSPADNPCNDIFAISGGSFSQNFVIGDYNYTVNLLVDGLTALSNSACTAVGVPSGCSGFTTVEGLANHFDVNMSITASEIPEPSTVLLLGLAMFGIVASSRSKRI